jgi:protein SCO1/2
MSKKSAIYIGFFGVLVIIFFLVVRKWLVKDEYISVVQPFSFTNQDGQQVTERDVEGKVYVVEYFFTTCRGVCPVMNKNMRQVYEKFKGEKDFRILSHTCQPEVDSVPLLKHYADSMKVDTRQWIFLTGRKDSLYNMARVSYTLDDPANNLQSIDDAFMHTQFWALVNRKGQVKKIYDGLRPSEVGEIEKDIRKLLKD